MKILFTALVILNIAFFAWNIAHDNSGDPGKRTAATDIGGTPSLVLLSEREVPEAHDNKQDQVAQDEQQDQVVQDEQQTRPASCYSIGPFQNRHQVEKLLADMQLPNIQSGIEEEADNQRVGYWVRWPEEMTLAEARSVMGELIGKGVTDLTITPQDNKRYAISLGIFSSRHYMEQRVDEMIALGYTPVVEDRYNKVINYWLRLEISDAAIMDKLSPLVQQIQDVEVISETCQ